MFTDRGLESVSSFIEGQIYMAAYVLNGIEIESKFQIEREQGNIFLVKFFVFPEKCGEITEIRLYDGKKNLWYQKREDLEIRRADGKFYYVCKIKVDEVIGNE